MYRKQLAPNQVHLIRATTWRGRCCTHLGRMLGFPGGASGKEAASQCTKCKGWGFDPWVGKIPWRRARQPTPVFLPGESQEQRSLAGYSPYGCKEVDMTEVTWAHTPLAQGAVTESTVRLAGGGMFTQVGGPLLELSFRASLYLPKKFLFPALCSCACCVILASILFGEGQDNLEGLISMFVFLYPLL